MNQGEHCREGLCYMKLNISLITIFGAILTARQSGQKFQCLYGNPMKTEKITGVCMTGGMHYTPSHTNVRKFLNFQPTFSQLI